MEIPHKRLFTTFIEIVPLLMSILNFSFIGNKKTLTPNHAIYFELIYIACLYRFCLIIITHLSCQQHNVVTLSHVLGEPFNPQLVLVVMILGIASALVTSRTGGRDFCSHLGWTFGVAKHTCQRLEQNVVFFSHKVLKSSLYACFSLVKMVACSCFFYYNRNIHILQKITLRWVFLWN